MNYDIVAKGFTNKRARILAARHIARESGVPFKTALAMTERPPVRLRGKLDRREIASCLRVYAKAGIIAQAFESIDPERKDVSGALELPPIAALRPLPDIRIAPLRHPVFMGAVESGSATESLEHPAAGPSHRRIFSGRRSWIIVSSLLALACCGIVFFARTGPVFFERLRRLACPGSKCPGVVIDSVTEDFFSKHPPSLSTGQNDAQPLLARMYVDSAQQHATNAAMAIRFYTLAIAFNKRNLNAWYGLIGAYRAAGRADDEKRTRKTMWRLFGETVFSIEKIIRPFGSLTEYCRIGEGGVFVEYRSRAPAMRAALLREIYTLARTLGTMDNYPAITIFATTDPSHGLLVQCGAGDHFESIERFEAESQIYFFERSKKKQ